jgi:hypothetical protein
MLNIRELEKRWLRYKIKSYTPYAVIIVSLIIILSILFIFIIESNEPHPKTKPVSNKIQKTTIKKAVSTSQIKKNKYYYYREENKNSYDKRTSSKEY